jgi:2-oxoisovalerate dehydrogenase E2 component (dihydrolipoyl transacylase)
MAKTGTPLVDIETSGGGADAAADADGHAAPSAAHAADPAPAAASTHSAAMKSLATPAVRRIAREHGISVSNVSGTGKSGRVTKDDILQVVGGAGGGGSGGGAEAAAAAAAPSAPLPAPPRPAAGPPAADTVVPLRGLARAMSKSMAAAWSVPHFGFADEVSVDALMRTRAALKGAGAARGVKLTYLPFLIKAASLALYAAPGLNARVHADGEAVVHRGAHNIGVAMDSPRGLVVPVVRAVQGLSVLEIAEELARLYALANDGALREADLADNTFT